jgi:hypothetical protein
MLFVAVLLHIGPPIAQGSVTVTIGTIGSGNSVIPFGGSMWMHPPPSMTYQQVYNATLFRPMSITGITFFNSRSDPFCTGDYAIYLSTTTRAVNDLDTVNFGNNRGADNTLFWSGSLSGNPRPSFTFSGPAFNYNPTNGNLLIDVQVHYESLLTGAFDAMNGTFGTDSSRASDLSTPGFENSYGLVTRFTGDLAPVPLPPTILFLVPGLAGLIAARRWLIK